MPFPPIAIVGTGCVLPGAMDPDELWRNISAGRVSIGAPPPGRGTADPGLLLPGPLSNGASGRHCLGGYIDGFDSIFDPLGFRIEGDRISGLDPLVRWGMHCGREALRQAGRWDPPPTRTGLILGNLGFPSRGFGRFAEHHWRTGAEGYAGPDHGGPDPRNRFPLGLTAHLIADALGLDLGAFALDAACASSLYAVKLAADRLHDGSADLMLAAAVNGVDELFLQAGFRALNALSPTGRSRPFHRDADGLVPAEGAACVALMRLEDAAKSAAPVLGVIRGIGLSNDGRNEGFLVPAQHGQELAMRRAYRSASLRPSTISLVECHATGTPVGDAVEVRSLAEIFTEVGHDLPIGSIKANLGHSLTVAGMAGLLKVLAAIGSETLPATVDAEPAIADLSGTPLRLLTENMPWTGRRRAAVSTFGFGGNNAHLIVEAYDARLIRAPRRLPPPPIPEAVAIVAMGARVGTGTSVRDLAEAVLCGKVDHGPSRAVDVDLEGLRFPPKDLRETLPQQVMMMEAAREAVASRQLPADRTMVLIGMGIDAEIARYCARARLTAAGDSARDSIGGPLTPAGGVGCMANITANRLNWLLNLTAPGFAVFAEESSGLIALSLGSRAVACGEVDYALVGAVDLSCEPIHRQALRELGRGDDPGDAAVALLLRRHSDAIADGDEVIALLDPEDHPSAQAVPGLRIGEHRGSDDSTPAAFDPADLFGNAHAAQAMVYVAVAALALRHRTVPTAGALADPLLGEPRAVVDIHPLGARPTAVTLRSAAPAPGLRPVPRLRLYSGQNRRDIAAAVASDRESGDGPARLALVDDGTQSWTALRDATIRWASGTGPRPPGSAFRDGPLTGEVAFVYPNGAAAYPKMGHHLMLALPDLIDALRRKCGSIEQTLGWAYADPPVPRHGLDQNCAASLLATLHTTIIRDILEISPAAALGYSSGESSALVALDVWRDIPGFVSRLYESNLFTREVSGEQRMIREQWRRLGAADEPWINYVVPADADRVRAAIADEPAAHLTVINAPGSCVIGGAPSACARVFDRLGVVDTAIAVDYDFAAHTHLVQPVRGEWRRLHHWPMNAVPGIRFYSATLSEPYAPTPHSAAEALTRMALRTIDFPAMVEQAWSDGVRIFIEQGPGSTCTGWISRILGDREHLAVAVDGNHRNSVTSLLRAVAQLFVAGLPMNISRLFDRLGVSGEPIPGENRRTLRFPAHPAPVHLGELHSTPRGAAPVASSPMTDRPGTHEGLGPTNLPGPKYNRAELERLAGGSIATVFGAAFAEQDRYERQTRLPTPPMLLVDRVTGIDAEPATMGTGTIWTETEIGWDAWYLDPAGRMPAGLMGEAGQADLLLISWLGIDLLNRGERVYRLLGCELTYHDSPPLPGQTLRFAITIDGHAQLGGVRLFFFRYDCHDSEGRLRISVRSAQAGFFTDAELAASSGVLWTPVDGPPPTGPLDPPTQLPELNCFGPDAVLAFAAGRPADCFGAAWERTRAHVRPPALPSGRMLLLREVTAFDPAGGPHRRGYLRAELPLEPESWFYQGHFKNDPCMPGTLMLEGCLQALAFYLAAHGHTIARDGWRFEPVTGRGYRMLCRGQATPHSRLLVYELYITAIKAGPEPEVTADALVSVDGVKAFHVGGLAVRLVPDWPLEHWQHAAPAGIQQRTATPVPPHTLGGLVGHTEQHAVAETDGVSFGYAALLAAAWGRPTHAFGPSRAALDGPRRTPRVPAPPFLFMSRIVEVDGPIQGMKLAHRVVVEYDLPREVWYRTGANAMPFCVLLEAALQPCGWLALYGGKVPESGADPLFRNLNGTATVTAEVSARARMLRTEVELLDLSQAGDVVIESFSVRVYADELLVLDATTTFGFFPPGAFTHQTGLAVSAEERAALTQRCPVAGQVTSRLERYFADSARRLTPMLRMLDRITGYWPEGGKSGRGRLLAERRIAAEDWYFRAHFFQDPVQPGSLGLEAMCQLLEFYLIESQTEGHLADPHFEPVRIGQPIIWKYRGQVVPTDMLVTIEMEITETGTDARGRFATAEAWLWVDGRRIYHTPQIGTRLVVGYPR
ncbi:beta-ketoacyl synthase N-terminal-like domain-containing protein [Nocardia goodfellowii]|uniref:Acyl transferase domain-containing protein/3-hydroxymyristoyl/3-hydroxydecanoyl-(Acyl carrier protein) dehydratase n=1 Tax=Nocardia goodfellowii TaxID=882446 RepID=A0ABS4QLN9_9NOCA|nr:beta-ketoacyl synthase N-terminal-like domain-containing protein [Nocardia goodfellowii]MBP2191591.1 acyl transferase domain-containing protein/3-hydroxymyristoyl/3-hydroxydecanoyl-(acyl carrier protein) dehydratase [Nocardia goodfellowii]